MTETKWTPGPWVWKRGPLSGYNALCAENGDNLTTDDDGVRCENEADAHLIAAAPELYEALQRASDALASLMTDNNGAEWWHLDALNKADTILAKARGEA